MYKLVKDKGYNSNVTLENLDTHVSIALGKTTIPMMSLMSEIGGIKFDSDDSSIAPDSPWELEVSDDLAKALASTAMTMRKPKRDQSKKKEVEQPAPTPEEKPVIDAMDVLLGLARY